MNRWTGPHTWGSARRIALVALGGALIACSGTGAAKAQVGIGGETGDSAGADYFARGYDPRVAATVRTVEIHHLSDANFWRAYREGNFAGALSDLLFILRYVPNHPKVLYLMAFDKNLNKDTSLIIQHFERAIKLFPRSAYTYAQYGHYLSSIGQDQVGIALLDEAIWLDPDLIMALAWREEAKRASPRSQPAPSGGTAADAMPGKSSEQTPERKQ